jgi:arabinofuranosyltransferase
MRKNDRFQRRALGAGMLLLLGGILLHVFFGYTDKDLSGHTWGIDDAYISYRYAQQFWSGHGLVFNVGERIEGYTNLFYVLLIVPAFLFTEGLGIYAYSVSINSVFALCALYLFWTHAKRHLDRTYASVAVLFFCLTPTIWLWVSSGLETPLVLVCQLALWVLAEKQIDVPKAKGSDFNLILLVSLILILTRADGILTPGIVVFYFAIKGKYRLAINYLAVILFAFALHVLWRFGYYADPLPNTYYAKVSGPLLQRIATASTDLWAYAVRDGLLLVFLFFLGTGLHSFKKSHGSFLSKIRSFSFEYYFAFLWIIYWFYIGGDVFAERFLLSLYPMSIFILLKTTQHVKWTRTTISFLAVCLFLQVSVPLLADERFQYATSSRYDRWVALGKHLAAHHPGARIAIDAAGKVPFFAGTETIDMLGLTDRTIAFQPPKAVRIGHKKYDADYVLSRKPEFIITWLTDRSFNFEYGMTREKYTKDGYALFYLVYAKSDQIEFPIKKISHLQTPDIHRLISKGYYYGVLKRMPEKINVVPPDKSGSPAPLISQ